LKRSENVGLKAGRECFTADIALKDEATQRIVNTFPILFEADMRIMGTVTKFSQVLW